jgi:hypothetical protein
VKVYKHYRPRNAWAPMLLMGLFAITGVVGLVWSAIRGSDEGPPFPFFLVMLAVVGINLWVLAGSALEVRLDEGGMVEFVAPLRRARIPVGDIISITPSEMSQGSAFLVKHLNGAVRLDPKLDGMHELIAELKRPNAAIELRGI